MAVMGKTTIIIVSSLGVIFVILVVVLICYCRQKCYEKQHNTKQDVEVGFHQCGIPKSLENKGFETNKEATFLRIESAITNENAKFKREKTVECQTCDKFFKTEKDLGNHERDTQCSSRRFDKYRLVNFNDNIRNEIAELCKKSALEDPNSYELCKHTVREVLTKLLSHPSNVERFKQIPDREGSSKIGLKTRKATEFDFSVKILLTSHPDLLWKPVRFKYENDKDVESFKSGKRDLGAKETQTCSDATDIPPGYVCVRIQKKDVPKFKDSCCRGIFSAFGLLRYFYIFLTTAAKETKIDGVTLTVCKTANGPAVKLVIKHKQIKHNINVDITPKIEIPVSFIHDMKWPRTETQEFLLQDKIQDVLRGNIYLVPKGDKYWAISFANYENDVINLFKNQSTEKKIIRCMKVNLERWQAQSTALREISSYMIKVVFLWLHEQLPEEYLWEDDQVTERYNNFLHELLRCFRDRKIKSYFLPNVDLLRHKTDHARDEMIAILQQEIKNMEGGREIFIC